MIESPGCEGKLQQGLFALQTHKALVLLLTFWCYACFHASRKPLSVVKSVLTGESNVAQTIWAAYDAGPLDPRTQQCFALH